MNNLLCLWCHELRDPRNLADEVICYTCKNRGADWVRQDILARKENEKQNLTRLVSYRKQTDELQKENRELKRKLEKANNNLKDIKLRQVRIRKLAVKKEIEQLKGVLKDYE